MPMSMCLFATWWGGNWATAGPYWAVGLGERRRRMHVSAWVLDGVVILALIFLFSNTHTCIYITYTKKIWQRFWVFKWIPLNTSRPAPDSSTGPCSLSKKKVKWSHLSSSQADLHILFVVKCHLLLNMINIERSECFFYCVVPFVVSTAEDLVSSQVSYQIGRVFNKKITKLSDRQNQSRAVFSIHRLTYCRSQLGPDFCEICTLC
jgi:hypothetical protein